MNLVCPLCGRHVPVQVFDPSTFEDDITAVEVAGLGRGRGFQVTGRYSVLGDPTITGLISDRCQRILHLIHHQGYIHPQELAALRATLDQWIRYARRLETEKEELLEENEEHSTVDDDSAEMEMRVLLNRINRSANSDFDTLEDAIGFLLE